MYQIITYGLPGGFLLRCLFYGTESYYDPYREPWHFNGAFPSINDYVQYISWKGRMHMKALDEKKEATSAEVVPFLRVIKGGKPPGDGKGPWLSELKKGTIFLAQNIHIKTSLQVYCLTHIQGKARRLSSNESDGRMECFWVDPVEWCKYNHFFDIIGYIGEEGDPLEIDEPPSHIKQLVQKNEEQASMLMARDHELRIHSLYLGEEGLTNRFEEWKKARKDE